MAELKSTESDKPSSPSWWFVWLGTLILCFAFGSTRSYTSLAAYDDESYVMISLQTYLAGDRLYAETYSQYGPAYYQLQTPLHGWLGLPITHDIVRLKTVLTWLVICCLSGWLVFRICGDQLAGIVTTILLMIHLEKLGLEPAHPQEVVALLSAAALLLMTWPSRWLFLLAGVCAGLAGFTKLNAGATLAVALLFATAVMSEKTTLNRLARWATCFLVGALPLGIAALIWKSGGAQNLTYLIWPGFLCVASAMLLILVCQNANACDDETDSIPAAGWMWVALGGVLSSAAVVGLAFMDGNSFDELAWGVLWQHSFMTESFYQPVLLIPIDVWLAIGVMLLMGCFVVMRKESQSANALAKTIALLPAAAMMFVLLLLVVEIWKPIDHGLLNRGAAKFLTTVGPLMMPCLLLKQQTVGRLALAASGCLTPLLAHPVPGTQISLGTVSVLCGLVVCVFDAKEAMPSQVWLGAFAKGMGWIGACALIVSAAVFGSRWTGYTPIDQPGCHWLRLETDRAAEERTVAAAIKETEAEWLAFDFQNHNRFYFWTGKKPLTAINPTFWPYMVTESDRAKITTALSDAGNVCVVKVPHRQAKLSELAPHIESQMFDRWAETCQVGDWVVGVRRRD